MHHRAFAGTTPIPMRLTKVAVVLAATLMTLASAAPGWHTYKHRETLSHGTRAGRYGPPWHHQYGSSTSGSSAPRHLHGSDVGGDSTDTSTLDDASELGDPIMSLHYNAYFPLQPRRASPAARSVCMNTARKFCKRILLQRVLTSNDTECSILCFSRRH